VLRDSPMRVSGAEAGAKARDRPRSMTRITNGSMESPVRRELVGALSF
jgi:hypothetical protein